VWRHIKINGRFIGIGHLPHQKISRLRQVGDVPLIIQQLLFKIFWELLSYCHPTLQRQPHSVHEPYFIIIIIILLTAFGLSPSGSTQSHTTIHSTTQIKIHGTTQLEKKKNVEECGLCPV
jgi:hypothetical protein